MQDLHDRRKRIADAVRELRPAADLVPVITYIDDLDGASTSLYVSPQTEALLGVTEQQWLEDPDLWEKLLHPDDLERVLRENDASDATGYFASEYRIVTPTGEVRWIRDEAALVRENDEPLFWRGSMVDITDRKMIEQTLRRTEAQYEALVQRLPGAVYIEEAGTGHLLYLSPQIEEITGYPAIEFLRRDEFWEDILHPDDRERYFEADRRVEASGEPFLMEYRMIRSDGEEVWIRDESRRVVEEGVAPFWQGLAIDVTERRRAEREKAELLGRLVSAQEEERARIASSIHDEPIQKMTAVGLRLFTLRGHVHDEGSALVDKLESSVNEAIARLRGLLFELRPPALERDGLASAIRQYAETTATPDAPGISVDARLATEPSLATRTIAYRIVQEALANARRHAAATIVRVRLEDRDGGLLGRVADDGRGFDTEGEAPNAAHMGLVTMRERAEMAKGWLRIDSTAGAGTTVEFWLPGR
jgi:PAS domain S-box-containing protein